MYTTSRYASADTRGFARRLATRNREPYVARGKKTVQQLVDYAWKKGNNKLLVIEEKKDEAAIASAIAIDQWGKWCWAEQTDIHEIKGKVRNRVRQ